MSAPSPIGRRILILIPHPDDEVVGCAAMIARARAQGARVFACYLGHGYLARGTLWPWQRAGHARRVALRLKEAGAAASFLGLTVVERNTQRAAREIWPNLAAVKAEVDAAIQSCAPDRIWVPAYEGGNPDHDALNALASRLTAAPVFEFSEYHLAGGKPHANSFIEPNGTETVVALPAEAQAMKRDAFALYASERGNLSGLLTARESFRPLPVYDYSRPPHAGKLWYERFQWVPFRHPQVDYTRGKDVCAAIRAYLGTP